MDFVSILVYLMIAVIFLGTVWFLLGKLPEPMKGYAYILFYVLCAILAILFLLQFVGGGGVRFPVRR